MTTATLPDRKTERIEARVSPDFKELVERAAMRSGHSLSNFMLTALTAALQRSDTELRQVTLNASQSRAFVKAILSPPKPNKRLRDALADYHRQVKNSAA